MIKVCNRVILVLIIVSMLVLAMAPVAQATLSSPRYTSVDGYYVFTVLYGVTYVKIYYEAHLRNKYVLDSYKNIQINTNHSLGGYYNYASVSQAVTGSIAYYDGGSLKSRLSLTSTPQSYVPPGSTGWGGSNSSIVNLCTLYGGDWVDGDTSWTGWGSRGVTNPPSMAKRLRYTYR